MKQLRNASDMPDMNILIVRPDRIGDVVLSTPVFTSIRRACPSWRITALLKPMTAELLEGHPDIDEIITLDSDDKPSLRNTWGLRKKLRKKKFDIAIHLYSNFWVSLAVGHAGIPTVIGPASKIAQLFYTDRVTQRRSKRGRHETDYNLELLDILGIPPIRKSSLPLDREVPPSAIAALDGDRKNIGLFPCMGGSALNWSFNKYAKLARSLKEAGHNVIFICGPGDEDVIDLIAAKAEDGFKKVSGLSLKEFASFTAKLDLFIAPSTGPLHIASAVGTPSAGIYCPIRVCLPSRWGPIGEKDISFVPDVPVCEKCRGVDCEYHNCMDKLEVETVFNAVTKML
jgi:ADP-heptose:LPS heptosyltransferase